jgi:hypothetical protein
MVASATVSDLGLDLRKLPNLADLVAVRAAGGDTPEHAFVSAGPRDVEAVLSGGTWRVRDGRLMLRFDHVGPAARKLAERIRSELLDA